MEFKCEMYTYFLGCHSVGRVHTEVIHGWNVACNARLSAPFGCIY